MISRLFIYLVRFYQHIAPQVVRNRCRFEPSCSEYAVLALEKYSVLRALRLVVDRLRRCRYPNGGEDYP
ncbi:membrane protein insertion efficiency factor YidD [Pacificispira sp.]|jgi:putative membrane protein insertion efficiency factor|uniref:membrane protein insertion efficiency factor YidD n=1 Tax=Pacificispira sp. TaxID=2888761 RepID=UPI003B51D0DC